MIRRLLLVLFLALPLCAFAEVPGMTSEQCGTCHDSQYNVWKQGKHNMKLGACSACHGEFHSGSLKGCTQCHSSEHKLEYKNWEFVKDYIVEGDTSDYYCIRCHDPHNPGKASMLVCNTCHGTKTGDVQPRKAIRLISQKMHNTYAWAAPALEESDLDKAMKTTSGRLMLAGGGGLIGFALLFPYLFTGYVFVRWVARKLRRKNNP